MAEIPSADREQKKKRIIMMILLAVLLMSVSMFLVERKESSIIVVTFPNGTQLEAEVADTPEKLLFGLAFQEALPLQGGMIYIFESTGTNHFWTKAYRFPIDVIWIDESHHVVQVMENVLPCGQDPCPEYRSESSSVRYAIQTAAGFIKKEGVTVGDDLKYTLRM
ncbi:DUF192 domain-containing protein [Petrachloros mirabilis]